MINHKLGTEGGHLRANANSPEIPEKIINC